MRRTRRRRYLPSRGTAVALAVACGALVWPTAAGALADFPYPEPEPLFGDTQVHDPSMLIRPTSGPRYAVYSTGDFIRVRTSNDGITFSSSSPAFATRPAWWSNYTGPDRPDKGNAPDVSFHNGQYWMYYAVTCWPCATSNPPAAIGLATSPDGLAGTWVDRGVVYQQDAPTTFKSVDPNLIVVPGQLGQPDRWFLTYGSAGIAQIELNPANGMPLDAVPNPTDLAEHPGPAGSGGTEASFMYHHGDFYYLFTSWGTCCKVDATYNIRLGRSSTVNGTFKDRSGTPLMSGGGTLVLEGHGDRVGAAGGAGVFLEPSDNQDRLFYHWYDKADTTWPNSYLGINDLQWTADGWPYLTNDYGPKLPSPYRIFSTDYLQSPTVNGVYYKLVVGPKCDLSEHEMPANTVPWHSNTSGRGSNCRLVMGQDGFLALYNGEENHYSEVVWHAPGTAGTGSDNYLRVQPDGNLVIYKTVDNAPDTPVCALWGSAPECFPTYP